MRFPIPEFASWESTLRCNMTCKHCGVSAGPSSGGLRGGELTTIEAEDMMMSLVKLGVQKLVISGGEFTTRHDWKELLALSLDLFLMTRMISNGWMGTRVLDQLELLDGHDKLLLSLSLDGMKDVHDANRRDKSFDRVIQILKANSPIRRTVITTVMNKNFGELQGIFNTMLDCGVPVWAIQIGLPAGYMPKSECISDARAHELADMILGWQQTARGRMEVIPDNCFGYTHPMRADRPWTGCDAGKNLITILSNGDVTGCPTTFEDVCGTIRDDSLESIWTGIRMEEFRIATPNCGTCQNSSCFGGCRAVQKARGEQFCF